MEGCALAAMLPPWSYKSELLTPKPEAYHHLHFEGHHPRQGDKQEKTVLPCMWQSSNTIRAGHMHHIALCCLEGSTTSNLVHRRRRCARIVSYMVLLPGGQYARGQGFIFVYRLAIDARTLWGDGDVAD